jgi:hypothetical protein
MRKLIFLVLVLLMSLPLSAQEATPEAEETLRLRPFTLPIGNVSGVAPAGWEELQVGSYLRGEGDTDQTYILHVAAEGVPLAELVDPFIAAYGLTSLPESSESYQSSLLDWTIYSFDFMPTPEQNLRVDLATTEYENRVYLVLLQSFVDDNALYREQVFMPALEYFGLPIATIRENLGYEALTPVVLQTYAIESAYPISWSVQSPGSYMREDSATLLIQTSPDLTALEFVQQLLDSLSVPLDLPEEFENYEANLDWTIYQIDFVANYELSLLIALAEDENLSYMIVLLCLTEEADILKDSVLLPVLDATRPLE